LFARRDAGREREDGMSEHNESTENQNDPQPGDDLTGLKSALDKEREARKTAERAAKDLEKRLAAIENSGKSESEKIAARLAELEQANAAKDQAIRERDARDAIRAAARKAGASPDAVDAVYRMVRGDIAYDDDGAPKNVDDLLKDAKQIAPQLFRASPKADGGAGNGSKPGGQSFNQQMNAAIRQKAGFATE